jgi:hypothetical protein
MVKTVNSITMRSDSIRQVLYVRRPGEPRRFPRAFAIRGKRRGRWQWILNPSQQANFVAKGAGTF